MSELDSDHGELWIRVLADEADAFAFRLLQGYFFKDMVTLLLDQAGYDVYPYGYESFLSSIKRKWYRKEITSSPSLKRIRSAPDLVVHDPETKAVKLVEVRSRKPQSAATGSGEVATVWADPREFAATKEFWPEATVVLVTPITPFFLAQQAGSLPSYNETPFFDEGDFEPIDRAFPKIASEISSARRAIFNHWVKVGFALFSRTLYIHDRDIVARLFSVDEAKKLLSDVEEREDRR